MEEFVFNRQCLPKALCVWFSENYLHSVDVYLWLVATRNALLPIPQGYERNFLFQISKRGHEKLIRWFRNRMVADYHAFNNDVCCGLAAGQHFWLLEQYKTPNVCRDPEVIGLALAASRDVKVIDKLEEMGFVVASPLIRYITANSDLETLQKLGSKYIPVTKLFVHKRHDVWWRGGGVYNLDAFIEDCLKYADIDYCYYVIDQCRSVSNNFWFCRKLVKTNRVELIMHCSPSELMFTECLAHGTLETFQALFVASKRPIDNLNRAIFSVKRDAIKKFEWLVHDLGMVPDYEILSGYTVLTEPGLFNEELLKHIVVNKYYDKVFLHPVGIFDSELRPFVIKEIGQHKLFFLAGFLYIFFRVVVMAILKVR